MALGTITRTAAQSASSDKPVYFDRIAFAGDGAYPTGGTTGFDALVKAKVGDNRDVLAVIPMDCGGYVPVYAPATTGNLKVYYGDNNNASDGPLIEVPNATDLSAVTFNLMVLSA